MPAIVGACVLFFEMPPWDRMGCKHTSKYTKNFFGGFGVFILLSILEVRCCCCANGKARFWCVYIASYIGGEMMLLLCKWEGLLRKRLMSTVPKSSILVMPLSIFEILNEILRPVL
jgi:hypothetical protein